MDINNREQIYAANADISLPDLSNATPLEIAEGIHQVLYKKKGRNIQVIEVKEKTVIADFFVLSSATSGTQARALAEIVVEKLKEAGVRPIRVEGLGERRCEWAVVDYGSVMVHVFTREAREFYNLDRLYRGTGEVYTMLPDGDED